MEPPPREPPWAEHEKVYLLAEILKAAPIPSHVLYGIIRDARIQPRWSDIPLPQGRSLRSCQAAYNELMQTFNPPTQQEYPRPGPPLPPTYYHPPEPPKRRPLPPPETSASAGRLIQPRPSPAYPVDMMSGQAYAPMVPIPAETANRKKRGRPTKAEQQARAEQAAARGEQYPPPRRHKIQRQSLPASETSPAVQMTKQVTPERQLGAPLPASTPQNPIAPRDFESSSEMKRRSLPSRLEFGERPEGLQITAVAHPSEPPQTAVRESTGSLNAQPTPPSAGPSTASEPQDKDNRTEGFETRARTGTPRSFKDTVGI